MIAEAWGGHRQMPVHFVEREAAPPPGPRTPVDVDAVCGEPLNRVVLYPDGSAAEVHVDVCSKCKSRRAKRAEARKPKAPVVPIGAARRRRAR